MESYSNSSGYYSEVSEGLLIFANIMIAFVSLILIIGLVIYIFQAIGLYCIAKRRGINNSWLAWIPVGSVWIIGSLADQYSEVAELKKTKYRLILLWLEIGTIIISSVSFLVSVLVNMVNLIDLSEGRTVHAEEIFIGSFQGLALSMLALLISITLSVFVYIALYKIYKSCQPSNAMLYLLLSIFIGSSSAIILFIIRKKDEGINLLNTAPSYQKGGAL